MSGEMMTIDARMPMEALTASEIQNRVMRIREVQEKVMQEGVDYGTIPGCGDKPTLFKPGAETLLMTFHLAAVPDQTNIQDLGDEDEVRYRVIMPIVHAPSGRVIGAGVGECSSMEEKYKWRKAVCEEEFEEADPDRRRQKWAKGQGGSFYQIKQIRTNKADVANTVLKMGKKRALVDGALTVTAASRIFTQDVEDMPEELRGDSHDDTPKANRSNGASTQKRSNGPLMPKYAGKYADRPISDCPTETIKEFLPGLEKTLDDPNKANFKARNQATVDEMKRVLAEREGNSPPKPTEQPASTSEAANADAPPSDMDIVVNDYKAELRKASAAELTLVINEIMAHKALSVDQKTELQKIYKERMESLNPPAQGKAKK